MPRPKIPQHWHPVWTAADYHDVFERARAFHAAQAAGEVVVDESGLVIR